MTATETRDFLDALTGLDVPIFHAPAGANVEFERPAGWQLSTTGGNAAALARHEQRGGALMAALGGALAVVDVDTKNGADAGAVRAMLDGIGCRVYADVLTPSGGRHYYVPGHPDLPSVSATAERVGLTGYPGVEVLSFGRNVFLPGTTRPKYDGAGYVVLSNDLAVLADGGDDDSALALAGWVAQHRATTGSTFTPAPPWDGTPPDARQQAYLDAVLERMTAEVGSTTTGGRNDALHRAALAVGNYVAGAGMDEQRGIGVLLDAARANGLLEEDGERACLATIHSGIRYGRGRPRAVPEPAGERYLAGGSHEPPAVNTETGEVFGEYVPEAAESTVGTPGASWAAVDLSETVAGLLAGTVTRLAPSVGLLEGAGALFYAGKVNGLAGASGSGKSWTALAVTAQELVAGRCVVYVDLEDDAVGVVGRLLDLGVPGETILGRFRYVHPDEALSAVAVETFAAQLDAVSPSLVVIDSTGESMALEGAKPNDDDDTARWFRRLPTPVARRTGAAVLVLDHVVKADEGGLWPIGSQRKRAAISGAQYMQTTVRPFARDADGAAKLVCAKDRHGNYRTGQKVAELVVTVEDGSSRFVLRGSTEQTGSPGDWRPTALMEKISRALEAADEPLSFRGINAAVKGKEGHIRTALRCLVDAGHVTVTEGPRRAQLHTLERPYAQRDDPGSDLYSGRATLTPDSSADHPVTVSVSIEGRRETDTQPSPGDSRETVGDSGALRPARDPLPTDDNGRPTPCPSCGLRPHHRVGCTWGLPNALLDAEAAS